MCWCVDIVKSQIIFIEKHKSNVIICVINYFVLGLIKIRCIDFKRSALCNMCNNTFFPVMIATQSQQWDWDVPPTCTNICPYSMQSQGGFWCSTRNACNCSQPLTNHSRFLMFARGMCVGLCDWGFSN